MGQPLLRTTGRAAQVVRPSPYGATMVIHHRYFVPALGLVFDVRADGRSFRAPAHEWYDADLLGAWNGAGVAEPGLHDGTSSVAYDDRERELRTTVCAACHPEIAAS